MHHLHKAHRASVMYCTQCHAQAEAPEGWLSMAESNNRPVVPHPDRPSLLPAKRPPQANCGGLFETRRCP